MQDEARFVQAYVTSMGIYDILYVCMYVCMSVCLYVLCMYVFIMYVFIMYVCMYVCNYYYYHTMHRLRPWSTVNPTPGI